MDLEWNQGTKVSEEMRQKLPFEIIEIGAIKLNNERVRIGEFHRVIKPSIYKELFSVTKSIVQIGREELEEGVTFLEAVRDLFAWCGENYRFCTWGTMDLVELQRNMRYYSINNILTKVFPYCDIQKIFSLQVEGKKNPRTLEYAVENFKLKKEDNFHRALWDAEYTAKIFQKLNKNLIDTYYSMDFFNNPKSIEEEIYINYGTYSKYISREFATKEDALSDSSIRELTCYVCKQPAIRKVEWFSNNIKNYYCLGRCREHGYLKGRIQINKGEHGSKFVIKIVSRINKEAAGKLKIYHDEVIEKKQEGK